MNKQVKQGNFVTSALLLSFGGLLAKILGALYRIPLTNILGSYGMGLYQLVFPPYILFLTLCQLGVPVALNRLLSEKNQLNQQDSARKIFKFCFLTLLATGVLGAVLLASLSGVIANFQGNSDTTTAFIIVAPALIFVPVTNCLKNFFNAKMNMLPSAATTVVEQIIKLTVGLICANYFMPDVVKAVYGAVFAITVSEFCSMTIMSIVYLVNRKKTQNTAPVKLLKDDVTGIGKQLAGIALPIALGAFVMQMSQVIDSVMVVNLLTVNNATNLYGLWTGPVNSMLGLPIALSAGVAVSALPSITRTFVSGDKEKLSKSFNSAFKLTLVIALPCAFGIIVLSKQIISLLYSGLTPVETSTAAMLLSLSGLSIIFIAILQTTVSVLQAINKPYVSVIVLSFAIIVKTVVNLVLLPQPNINIYGAAISETMCYLFATICVILYLTLKQKLRIQLTNSILKPLAASLCMTLALTVLVLFAEDFISTKLGTLIAIVVAGIVYLATIMLLKTFDETEMKLLKRSKVNAVAE